MRLGASYRFQRPTVHFPASPASDCSQLPVTTPAPGDSSVLFHLLWAAPPMANKLPRPISTEMKIICFCKFYVLIKFFTQYIWSCFSNSSQILPTSLSSILSLFQNKTKKQNKKTTKVRNKQTKNTMKTIIQTNRQKTKKTKNDKARQSEEKKSQN